LRRDGLRENLKIQQRVREVREPCEVSFGSRCRQSLHDYRFATIATRCGLRDGQRSSFEQRSVRQARAGLIRNDIDQPRGRQRDPQIWPRTTPALQISL
jgi:hypothetical protein